MNTPVEILETHLRTEIGRVVHGADGLIHGLLLASVARGHVLVQGAPGLGKTLIAKALARCLGGSFQRIQGTADLMPSDIIGVHVFDPREQKFMFHPGPLFADVVLMDEINRAGPKTQSALLEAMEERQVTVERERFELGERFIVLATQNPHEFEGTYPLPESQLDRFMLRLDVAYPAATDEAAVVAHYGAQMGAASIEDFRIAAIGAELMEQAHAQAGAVHVSDALVAYLLQVAAATRQNVSIALGMSTRAVLALTRAARIEAASRGADFATPDDVKTVATMVVAHRIVLTPEATLEGIGAGAIVARVLEQVPVPR
ncbi:MAG: MoxR family ATPase [Steroidobacteraceae bacterium]